MNYFLVFFEFRIASLLHYFLFFLKLIFRDHPIEVHLSFDQSHQPSIIHCSINGQRFQTILPNEFLLISLDFLPFVPGIQVKIYTKLI